jgi:hypothetical protein
VVRGVVEMTVNVGGEVLKFSCGVSVPSQVRRKIAPLRPVPGWVLGRPVLRVAVIRRQL